MYKVSTSLACHCGAWVIPRRVYRRLLPESIVASEVLREGGACAGSF